MILPPVSASLRQRLGEHSAQFSAWYPPNAFSDHGPMALLALFGLGASDEQLTLFIEKYQPRLRPLRDAVHGITQHNWQEHCGNTLAYASFLSFFEQEFEKQGARTLLALYLPFLASGWVKNAFHALIRLSYGIEFGVRSEIVAGLAYLASVGPDALLERAAAGTPSAHAGEPYLRALQDLRLKDGAGQSFDQRYQAIVATGQLQAAAHSPRPLPEISRAALAVFHSTHNFFALHLVTGMHAFRVCAPWLGPNAASLASVGIGAGYLALGAPDFAPLAPLIPKGPVPLARLCEAKDEHDVKIVYTCKRQTEAFCDPSYDAVAQLYVVG